MLSRKPLFIIICMLFVIAFQLCFSQNCLADLIPVDYDSLNAAEKIRKEQLLFNEKVTKTINSFKALKKLSPEKKEEYIDKFKFLLEECYQLKYRLSKGYELAKQKDIDKYKQWQADYKQYYLNKLKSGNNRWKEPRQYDNKYAFTYFYIAKYELEVDEKRLNNVLKKLEVEQSALPDKPEADNKPFLAYGIASLSILSFLALGLIRQSINRKYSSHTIIIIITAMTFFSQQIAYSKLNKEPSIELELVEAIKNGNKQEVKHLIAKGANVNYKDDNFKTPLHIALEERNLPLARYLIDNGAFVPAKTIKGKTTLDSLLSSRTLLNEKDQYDFAKLLIDKGAPVNANKTGVSRFGETFSLAISTCNPELLKLLIENGINLDTSSRSMNLFLDLLSTRHCSAKKQVQIFKILTNNNVRVSKSFFKNRLYHFTAAGHLHPDVLDYLLEQYPKLGSKEDVLKARNKYFATINKRNLKTSP